MAYNTEKGLPTLMLTQKYKQFINQLIKNVTSSFQKRINHPNVRFIDLIESMSDEFNQIMKSAIISFLEEMDLTYRNSSLRHQNYHVKKNEFRNLTTRFGNIRFKRTVYQHKYSGKIFTYVDRSLGLAKYDLYDPDIKSLILEYAADNSDASTARYITDFINKTSSDDVIISRQYVRYVINTSHMPLPLIEQKPGIDTLYIMADEKYVHTQGQEKDMFVRHVVVFEGFEKDHMGRNKLKNKYVIAKVGKGLKTEILDYINTAYDVNQIKRVYLMGDGAGWIKKISTYLKFTDNEVIRALDKFHFTQSVGHITRDKELQKVIIDYVLNGTKTDLKNLIKVLKKEHPYKQVTLETKLHYINGHKKEIQNLYRYGLSCPMEAQISHNIAGQFASRPKGYSPTYFNKRLELRMMHRNNINIRNHYLESRYGNLDNLNLPKINKQLFGIFDSFDPVITHTVNNHIRTT